MNRFVIWAILSMKRQLKRPLFVLMLVLAPVVLLWIGQAEKEGSSQISIALFTEDQSMAPEVMELLVREDGIFSFYVSPSEEALRQDVAARRAECGYVFGSDLKERLDEGNYKRCITVITAPSTVLAELSTEVVYSKLIDVYGRDILEAYSDSLTFLPKEERWKQLEPLYDRRLTDGSTFAFRYETNGEDVSPGFTAEETTLFPIRGIVAVGIFIMGLFSAAWLAKDEESGLFAPVPEGNRRIFKALTAGAPVVLAGISGLVALGISERGERFALELLLMALYVCLVTGVSIIMERIAGRPEILLGWIPFLAIAALVVCPVFVDLSPFVPAVRLIRWLLVPFYYLSVSVLFL